MAHVRSRAEIEELLREKVVHAQSAYKAAQKEGAVNAHAARALEKALLEFCAFIIDGKIPARLELNDGKTRAPAKGRTKSGGSRSHP